MVKRIVAMLLAALLLLSVVIGVVSAEETEASEAFEATGDYLASLGEPTAGSTGGEWMVLGLSRSGREVPEGYYDSAVAYVREHIDENERLHPTNCSTNCRFIIALTAIGRDVTDVDGHNLLAGLNELGYIRKAGISGLIWTLIAFDCGNYPMPQGMDREALVQGILDFQNTQGGWANSGSTADPDVTAMAIQALAPYRQENPAVQAAVDRAVTLLSEMQDSGGRFGSTSESNAQVIVALATLGVDPNTDPRFVKDGASAVDGLLCYYTEGGGFRHVLSGKRDGMATEQGYYALTAYFRLLEGKSPLYQMAEGSAELPQLPQTTDWTDFWWCIILGAGILILLVCAALKRKLGKRNFANAVMVVVILVAAALGIGAVVQTGILDQELELGTKYQVTAIEDNRLVQSEDPVNLCSITIRCDTVLNNLDRLDKEKAPYLPADGVILPETTVEFTSGESVFTVLQRVCAAAGIPLEYSWAPLYDSYYLEGIQHLYELDCGTESGWMYRVNGAAPNYGASSYEVQAGDKIEWRYSCIGLGADLKED